MSVTVTIPLILITALREAPGIDQFLDQLSQTSNAGRVVAQSAAALIAAAETNTSNVAATNNTPWALALSSSASSDPPTDESVITTMMSHTSINDLTTERHPGLVVRVQGLGRDICFRVKPETRFSRLLNACWEYKGVEFEECSWWLPRQGCYIGIDDFRDTFAQLGLIHDDVIVVRG